MLAIDPVTGQRRRFTEIAQQTEQGRSAWAGELGGTMPVVYGTARVGGINVFLRKLDTLGVPWKYDAKNDRWDCVKDPSDGVTMTGSTASQVRLTGAGLTVPAGATYSVPAVTYALGEWALYFRTGVNAGLMREIVGVTSAGYGAFNLLTAFPSAPTAGDLFSIGVSVPGETGSVVLALCEAPVTALLRIWTGDSLVPSGNYLVDAQTTAAELTANGAGPQLGASAPVFGTTSWGMEATASPDTIGMTFTGTVQWRAKRLLLDNGANPEITFEVQGRCAAATTDANPADVVIDLLSDSRLKVGMDASAIDVSAYRTYCQAMGFAVSRALTDRSSVSGPLADLLDQTNAAIVWSSGRLRVIPLGDVAVTGYGATYTPTDESWAIDQDDMVLDGDELISVERRPDDEVFNSFSVSYQDRTKDYSTLKVEYVDAADATTRGVVRAPPVEGAWITRETHAQALASIKAQRSILIRNTYRFKLNPRWLLLEPMDILSVTEPVLGLVGAAMRIKSIAEDEDGNVTIEAYEWPAGAAHPVTLAHQSWDGFAGSAGLCSSPYRLLIDGVGSQVDDLGGVLQDINDDNTLTLREKSALIKEMANITGEYGSVTAGAVYVTLPATAGTPRKAYGDAYAALTGYVATLTTPTAWNSLDGTTDVVGVTLRADLAAYYTARTVVASAISDQLHAAADPSASAPPWTPSTAYVVNTVVSNNGRYYVCTNNGTSMAASYPLWSAGTNYTVLGTLVDDGSGDIWKCTGTGTNKLPLGANTPVSWVSAFTLGGPLWQGGPQSEGQGVVMGMPQWKELVNVQNKTVDAMVGSFTLKQYIQEVIAGRG